MGALLGALPVDLSAQFDLPCRITHQQLGSRCKNSSDVCSRMIPLVKTLVNGEQRQENGFALQNHRH